VGLQVGHHFIQGKLLSTNSKKNTCEQLWWPSHVPVNHLSHNGCELLGSAMNSIVTRICVATWGCPHVQAFLWALANIPSVHLRRLCAPRKMDLLNLLRLSRAKPFKSSSHLVLSEHFLPHGWHGNSPETQKRLRRGRLRPVLPNAPSAWTWQWDAMVTGHPKRMLGFGSY